jgi:hypothetical protein
MRLRHALVVLSTAALVALQAAAAAETSTARFLVSLRATVTKQWSYTSTVKAGGCTTRISGRGTRTISMRTPDASVVTVRQREPGARVTFTGAIRPLSASITQTGTKTTTSSGPSGCEHAVRHFDCVRMTRSVPNLAAQLLSERLHKLSFRRMKGFVPDAFFNECPGEPKAVRLINAGLRLADANLDERDLFERSVGGLTRQGSADATTTLLNLSARIGRHVRWSLTLRRLGA